MRILLTGARGFLGTHLLLHLRELGYTDVLTWQHDEPLDTLRERMKGVQAVFHLAGVNRPSDPNDFQTGNADLTQTVCQALLDVGDTGALLWLASSTQATLDNPYGRSKRIAEQHAQTLAATGRVQVCVARLPGVFGKWCRPDYNSVVATFCDRLVRGLPLEIHDAQRVLELVYVDDVVAQCMADLAHKDVAMPWREVDVQARHHMTLGELARVLRSFADSRTDLQVPDVGEGLLRALYATYISYLPPEQFAYDLTEHVDARGRFVEFLKTRAAGQFSFFTAHPGVTRGGHYHHTKTEKFLVLQGHARFAFRHIRSGQRYTLEVSGERPQVVQTVPGWAHDITNIGHDDLIVMLWANEVFDRQRPDTYSHATV